MKKLAINAINFYQKFLSFDSAFGKFIAISPNVCRYSPTCSEYSKQAIQKYGILKGATLSIKRILSCHPFSQGGWDPVK
jgi:uncharacterized protein